jgi:hypothetical protein
MSITLKVEHTWYDAFSTYEELTQVQAAINEHLPPGVSLDWEALLAAQTDHPFREQAWYEEGVSLTSALELLCDARVLRAPSMVFVPIEVTAPSIVVHLPSDELALQSVGAMLDRWERGGRERGAETERLAQAYDPQQVSDRQNRPEWSRIDGACWQFALVRLARACLAERLPARIYW